MCDALVVKREPNRTRRVSFRSKSSQVVSIEWKWIKKNLTRWTTGRPNRRDTENWSALHTCKWSSSITSSSKRHKLSQMRLASKFTATIQIIKLYLAKSTNCNDMFVNMAKEKCRNKRHFGAIKR